MVTRGLVGFIYNNVVYYVFNWYDSYYSHLGVILLKELIEMINTNKFDEWVEKFKKLRIVKELDEISEEDLILFDRINTDNEYKLQYGQVIDYTENDTVNISFNSILNTGFLMCHSNPFTIDNTLEDIEKINYIKSKLKNIDSAYDYILDINNKEFIVMNAMDNKSYPFNVEILSSLISKWELI